MSNPTAGESSDDQFFETDPDVIVNTDELKHDIVDESVEKQFRDFEDNTLDPYKSIGKFAARQRAKFNNNYDRVNNTDTDTAISPAGASLLNYSAKQAYQSTNNVARSYELSKFNTTRLLGYSSLEPGNVNSNGSLTTGLINRPGVEEYNTLFADSNGSLNASFFQLQNKNIVGTILNRQNETVLNIQGLIPSSDGKAEKILAGNEITYRLAALSNSAGNSVLQINRAYATTDDGIIHPKVGFNDNYAFIGTQNITNALNGNNTQENFLVLQRLNSSLFNANVKGFKALQSALQTQPSNPRLNLNQLQAANQISQDIVANQIVIAQQDLTSVLRENNNQISSSIYAQRLRASFGVDNNTRDVGQFVYANDPAGNGIFERLSGVIKQAANFSTTDKVVISGKELSIIFNSTDVLVQGFKQDLLKLASSGRLNILTEARYLNGIYKDLNKPQSSVDSLGRQILTELNQYGGIQTSVLGMQHEKTTMIFGGGVEAGQLKFLATGSANYSQNAMLPDGNNVELMAMIGVDKYQYNPTNILERTVGYSILTQLNREVEGKNIIYERYQTLAGVNFERGKEIYGSTRIIEKNASSDGVKALRDSITQLNKEIGSNLITLQDRFNNSGKLVGLTAIIKPLDVAVGNTVSITLSVNRENNVLLSDFNKVITNSVYVNTGTTDKVVDGHVLKVGQSVELSALNTATSFVATIAREMTNQSRYGLVNTIFTDLLNRKDISMINSLSVDYLSMLVPELTTQLGEGKLNLHTTVNYLHKTYASKGDLPQLIQDIDVLSRKIAAGEISTFSKNSKEFAKELATQPHLINKRQLVIKQLLTGLVSGNDTQFNIGLLGFQNALQNDLNEFADFRLHAVLSDREGAQRYNRAFNSLTSSLVSLTASPFLALHEQTYNGYQAAARVSVYGDGDNPHAPGTAMYHLFEQGRSNPVPVSQSTKIGKPGEYYRGVNMTGGADNLKLPGYGGLNKVKVVDSDMHQGAVSLYNYEKLFEGFNNFGVVTKSKYQRSLNLLLGKQEDNLFSDDQQALLSNIFKGSDKLYSYALPDSKSEQIQQRIKNYTGARTDLDINPAIINQIKGLKGVDVLTAIEDSNLLIGKVKTALPNNQAELVENYINEYKTAHGTLPSTLEINREFRDREMDRSLTARGIVGESSIKKVIINAGFSNVGDYMYANPNIETDTGYLRLLSKKIDLKHVNNFEQTTRNIAEAFQAGNVVYNTPQNVDSNTSWMQGLYGDLETRRNQIATLETSIANIKQEIEAINARLGVNSDIYNTSIAPIKQQMAGLLAANPTYAAQYVSKKQIDTRLFQIKQGLTNKNSITENAEYRAALTNNAANLNDNTTYSFNVIDNISKLTTKESYRGLDLKKSSTYLLSLEVDRDLYQQKQDLLAANPEFATDYNVIQLQKQQKYNLTQIGNVAINEYVSAKERLAASFDLSNNVSEDFKTLLSDQQAAYASKATFLIDSNNQHLNDLEETRNSIAKVYSDLQILRDNNQDTSLFAAIDTLAQVKQDKFNLVNNTPSDNSDLDRVLLLTDQTNAQYRLLEKYKSTHAAFFAQVQEIDSLKQAQWQSLQTGLTTNSQVNQYINLKESIYQTEKEVRTTMARDFSAIGLLQERIKAKNKIKYALVERVKDNGNHLITRLEANKQQLKATNALIDPLRTTHASVFTTIDNIRATRERLNILEAQTPLLVDLNELNKSLFNLKQTHARLEDSHPELMLKFIEESSLVESKNQVVADERTRSGATNSLSRLIQINQDIYSTGVAVNKALQSLPEQQNLFEQINTAKEDRTTFLKLNKTDADLISYFNLNKEIKSKEDNIVNAKVTHLDLIETVERLSAVKYTIKKLVTQSELVKRAVDLNKKTYNLNQTYTEQRALTLANQAAGLIPDTHDAALIVAAKDNLDAAITKKFNLQAEAQKQASKIGSESVITKYNKLSGNLYKENIALQSETGTQSKLNIEYRINQLIENIAKLKQTEAAKRAKLDDYIEVKRYIRTRTTRLYNGLVALNDDPGELGMQLKNTLLQLRQNYEDASQTKMILQTSGAEADKEYLKLLTEKSSLETQLRTSRQDKANDFIFKLFDDLNTLRLTKGNLEQSNPIVKQLLGFTTNINALTKTLRDLSKGTVLEGHFAALDRAYQERKELLNQDAATKVGTQDTAIEQYQKYNNQLKQVRKEIKVLKALPENQAVNQYLNDLNNTLAARTTILDSIESTSLDLWKQEKSYLKELNNVLNLDKQNPDNKVLFENLKRLKQLKATRRTLIEEGKTNTDKVWRIYNLVNTELNQKETGLYNRLKAYKADATNKPLFDLLDRQNKLYQDKRDLLANSDQALQDYLANETKIKEFNQSRSGKELSIMKLALAKVTTNKNKQSILTGSQDEQVKKYVQLNNDKSELDAVIKQFKDSGQHADVFNLYTEIDELNRAKTNTINELNKTTIGAGLYGEYQLKLQAIKDINLLVNNHADAPVYQTIKQARDLIYADIERIKGINDRDLQSYITIESNLKELNKNLEEKFPELVKTEREIKRLKDIETETRSVLEKLTQTDPNNYKLLKELFSLNKQKQQVKQTISNQYEGINSQMESLESRQREEQTRLGSMITATTDLIDRRDSLQKKYNQDVSNLNNQKAEYAKKLAMNNLLLVEEGNKSIYQLDKGLYSFDETGKPIQLGRFESEGLITLNKVAISNADGEHTVLTIKIGSAKDEGYSLFTQNAEFVNNNKGVITIQTQELVVKNPASGSRLVGVKGPVLYLDENFFTELNRSANAKQVETGRIDMTPQAIKDMSIYSMNSFSQFKGFSFESGIHLLLDAQTQAAYKAGNQDSITGLQLAENLSLLFLEKNNTLGSIREALGQHLERTGRASIKHSLELVKGTDFSVLNPNSAAGSESNKFNLGVIANGLTTLADPTSADYERNVIKGSLAGVKETVLKALGGDAEAQNILQLQAQKLVQLTLDTQAINSSSGIVSLKENSPITRGAAFLTHLNFIGTQLLTSMFQTNAQGKQVNTYFEGAFELNVSSLQKYTTDSVHRQKVDFIASTAGLVLPFHSDDQLANLTDPQANELENKLNFLQTKFNSGVNIVDVVNITTSSSLVGAGINNQAAFEYQNLAGTSSSYLNRYRTNNKIKEAGALIDTHASQVTRQAYAMILGSTLNAEGYGTLQEGYVPEYMPSTASRADLSYRILLNKPASQTGRDAEGWHSDLAQDMNKIVNSYTPLAKQIGLLDASLQPGASRDTIAELNLVSRIATASIGKTNEEALIVRAVAIDEVTKHFNYLSDIPSGNNISALDLETATLQKENYTKQLINPQEYGNARSALDLTAKIISNKYKQYLDKVEQVKANRKINPDVVTDTFSEFVAKGSPAYNNTKMQDQLLKTIASLEDTSGFIKGLRGKQTSAEIQAVVVQKLITHNERQLENVKKTLLIDNVGRAKQYIDSLLSVEDVLKTRIDDYTVHNNKAQISLDEHNANLDKYYEVSKTRQIILPAFETVAQADGNHILKFRSTLEVAPHQGVLMGTDVVGKIPLIFPSHVEDVLINQIQLSKQISKVQTTLDKIQVGVETKAAVTLSPEEVKDLHLLSDLMNQSVEGAKSIAGTKFTQLVAGEHESFKGKSIVAVNSILLSAQEAVVGSAVSNLSIDNPNHQLIETYFKSLEKNVINPGEPTQVNPQELIRQQQRDLDGLQKIYENLGPKGDTLKQAINSENAWQATKEGINKNAVMSAQQIKEIQALYMQSITGMDFDKFNALTPLEASEVLNTRNVASRRTGAPAGIGVTVSDLQSNNITSIDTLNRRIADQGSMLKVDKQRSSTLAMLPTLSSLIAQQGDFDGDTFQLLMSNAGQNSKDLLKVKETQLQLEQKANYYTKILADRAQVNHDPTTAGTIDPRRTAEIMDIRSNVLAELEENNQEENRLLSLLSRTATAQETYRAAELTNMKKFVAYNQAIPMDALNNVSVGTLLSFSQFGRSTVGNIEGAESITQKSFDNYQRQSLAITTLMRDFDAIDPNNLVSYQEHLQNKGVKVSVDDLQQGLQALDVAPNSRSNLNTTDRAIRDYHARIGNTAQAFDNYQKHIEKGAGTLLTLDEVGLMQGLIGQAGTDLLGKSYNTLIPLLDQGMSNAGIQELLVKNKGNAQFAQDLESNILKSKLLTEGGRDNVSADRLSTLTLEARQESQDLLTKLTSNNYITQSRDRNDATFAFLGSMQQVIRDALKEKSGKGFTLGLKSILESPYDPMAGETVGSILGKEDYNTLNFDQINKLRNTLFKQYVGTKLGSNLVPNLKNLSPEISNLIHQSRQGLTDPGVTGFGALLMLRELALTDNEDDYRKRFVDKDRDTAELYRKQFQEGKISSPQEFATKTLLNLLQRTQASFADAMLSDPQRKQKVQLLMEYGASFTPDKLSAETNKHKIAGINLIQEYAKFTKTQQYLDLNADAKDVIQKQFSQELSLSVVKERGGLTVEDLYRLQQAAKDTQTIQRISNTVPGEIVEGQESALSRGGGTNVDPQITNAIAFSSNATSISEASLLQALRRGKLSADQAQTVMLTRLNRLNDIVPGDESGLTPAQQTTTALMLGFGTLNDLNPEQRQALAATVAQNKDKLIHDSEGIHALYGHASMYDKVTQALAMSTDDSERAELVQRQKHFYNKIGEALNVNQATSLQQRTNEASIANRPHSLEEAVNTITQTVTGEGEVQQLINNGNLHENKVKNTEVAKNKAFGLRHDPRLAGLAALAIPLLLGVFKEGISLDERALQIGYDVLQSTAHLATKQERLITKVGDLNPLNSDVVNKRIQNTSTNFQKGRIVQSLQSEGAIVGGLQSLIQENLFMASSNIAYKLVDRTLAKSGFENMKVGRGLAVIGAEVLSTVLALGLSRAAVKQKTNDGDYVPDYIGKMLQEFSQQVWLAAEQAQLDINKPEYEMVDTDENSNLEQTTTGSLSVNELDSITGFISIDDDTATIDNLASTVPTWKNA